MSYYCDPKELSKQLMDHWNDTSQSKKKAVGDRYIIWLHTIMYSICIFKVNNIFLHSSVCVF